MEKLENQLDRLIRRHMGKPENEPERDEPRQRTHGHRTSQVCQFPSCCTVIDPHCTSRPDERYWNEPGSELVCRADQDHLAFPQSRKWIGAGCPQSVVEAQIPRCPAPVTPVGARGVVGSEAALTRIDLEQLTDCYKVGGAQAPRLWQL
ncbi:hypothetical protein DPEC_G00329280 [Dallia pectoralis]|uniref:Uncharacterized protein n=1 Tax=Dallia pectoralis TaxID=75939 RepID=A0ACC2F8T3_DALPE|nr:hypothetical protein DPEC_G00329280 [Dallia pectoralis]